MSSDEKGIEPSYPPIYGLNSITAVLPFQWTIERKLREREKLEKDLDLARKLKNLQKVIVIKIMAGALWMVPKNL